MTMSLTREPRQMSNTTETTKVYLVRDNSGNFHEMDRKTCGHCKTELQIGEEYHVNCARLYREKEALMLRQRREKMDLDKYGQVLSDLERQMHEFPNSVVGLDGLTLNERKAKQELVKQQQERQKLQDEDIERRRIKGIMNSTCVVEMKRELEHKIKTLQEENAQLKKGN